MTTDDDLRKRAEEYWRGAPFQESSEAYEIQAYIAGAEAERRWWASRFSELDRLTNNDGKREAEILAELDAAAKEALK